MLGSASALAWALLQGGAQRSAQPGVLPDTLLADTAVVESPLPGGVASVVRFLFNLPQWFQIAGFILGVLVAIALLTVLWLRRAVILAWLRSRSRALKIALAAAAGVLLFAMVGFGGVSWNYMQHDNGFCTGCHVMTPAFQRFERSEHSKLECHDCHRQSIFASMRQLYFWVAERPTDIPPHAKVPTRICAECHARQEGGRIWQQIVRTAGHRVHLESDSSALRNVQCVTCHGVEVHRFTPVDRTCGQSGCHESIPMRLGKMAEQTELHCVGCHRFTAPLPQHVSVDSARASLRPGQTECFACHAMRERLAEFDPSRDPHRAVCGSCHNPHTQTTPKQAFESCGTSQCHARAETLTPLHRGIAPKALAQCGDCHKAHDWAVSGAACLSCHRDILRDGGSRPRRSAATDAAATAREPGARSDPHLPAPSLVLAARGPSIASLAAAAQATAQQRDSLPFSHRRHRDVECTRCHRSDQRHGELTVRTRQDCMGCHHAADSRVACTSCHQSSELAQRILTPASFRMTVWNAPRTRDLPFRHAQHAALECTTCHTAQLTRAVGRDCASCHAEHHAPTAECRTCHVAARGVHRREQMHQGCTGSGCHGEQATPPLPPAREVCLTCHLDRVNHKPGRECSACHQVKWTPAARAQPTQ